MPDYDNTNRGAVWKNDKKTTENHPDFRGDINIEGVEYWVSGWKRKQGANPNSPAMSLAVTKKEARPADAQPANPQPNPEDFDDIPF